MKKNRFIRKLLSLFAIIGAVSAFSLARQDVFARTTEEILNSVLNVYITEVRQIDRKLPPEESFRNYLTLDKMKANENFEWFINRFCPDPFFADSNLFLNLLIHIDSFKPKVKVKNLDVFKRRLCGYIILCRNDAESRVDKHVATIYQDYAGGYVPKLLWEMNP